MSTHNKIQPVTKISPIFLYRRREFRCKWVRYSFSRVCTARFSVCPWFWGWGVGCRPLVWGGGGAGCVICLWFLWDLPHPLSPQPLHHTLPPFHNTPFHHKPSPKRTWDQEAGEKVTSHTLCENITFPPLRLRAVINNNF